MLGDKTLEPTIAPSIYYWIPPQPTPGPPTSSPTHAPTILDIYHEYIVGAIGGSVLSVILFILISGRTIMRNRAGYIEIPQQSNV